jgi:hypothetical protein
MTMKEKFTQGEWRIEVSPHSTRIFNSNGFVASDAVINVDETRLDGESWIAMRDRTDSARNNAQIESQANVYVMAVATKMYLMLERQRQGLVNLIDLELIPASHVDGTMIEIMAIDKLLAEARGETT